MITLLDANVLIALLVPDHVHHQAVVAWWPSVDGGFATCPSTQGSLIRFLLREGRSVAAAVAVVAALTEHPQHVFWPDALSYRDVAMSRVTGHRQVTDAYLAALARVNGGSVTSLDRGFAAVYADVVRVVPSG